MTHYLIEFRFHGSVKHEIKKIIEEVNCEFELESKRAIPHITLVGPFSTDNEKQLIRDFNQLCSNYGLMDFEVDGVKAFDETKVVCFNVNPGKEMDELRWNFAQRLKSYCQLREYDYEREFEFHSTIAMYLPDDKFEKVKNHFNGKSCIKFSHKMVRATLVKDDLIFREYDFLLRRPLNRKLAIDKDIYSHTMDMLMAYFEGRYNPDDYIGERIRVPLKSRSVNIKDSSQKRKIFVTSDLHLDHSNIIKYCSRPFLSTDDMNKTLVRNWNSTVGDKDAVYFLGDLAYGRGSKSTNYWLQQLNGHILFIKGNHDVSNEIKFYDNFIFEYSNHKFFLTHRPEDIPFNWNYWAICGHHHNNKVQQYPFIDKRNKRIYVSVELTKYKPVDMDYIIKRIEE